MSDLIWPDCMERTKRETGAGVSCKGYGAALAELGRLRRELAEAQSKLNLAEAEAVSVRHWAERELAEARGLLREAHRAVIYMSGDGAGTWIKLASRIDALLAEKER